MKFRIGQKVVCKDASPGWLDGEKGLQKDRIYTVIGIPSGYINDIYIDNHGSWDASRFRPLIESWVSELLHEVEESWTVKIRR